MSTSIEIPVHVINKLNKYLIVKLTFNHRIAEKGRVSIAGLIFYSISLMV